MPFSYINIELKNRKLPISYTMLICIRDYLVVEVMLNMLFTLYVNIRHVLSPNSSSLAAWSVALRFKMIHLSL